MLHVTAGTAAARMSCIRCGENDVTNAWRSAVVKEEDG